MTPRIHSTTTRIGPAAYDAWRRTPLGALTERLGYGLVFEIVGRLDGLRVLDVGSGDGMFAVMAAQRGAVVTGVDPDPAMLAAAADRARAMGVDLRLHIGRAEQLPFADGAFDMVISIAVLCFVADADAAIREMARVLRPGGRLILGELNRWSSWAAIRHAKGLAGSRTWRGARFRTAAQLRRSVSAAGLSVVSVNGAVFYPPPASWRHGTVGLGGARRSAPRWWWSPRLPPSLGAKNRSSDCTNMVANCSRSPGHAVKLNDRPGMNMPMAARPFMAVTLSSIGWKLPSSASRSSAMPARAPRVNSTSPEAATTYTPGAIGAPVAPPSGSFSVLSVATLRTVIVKVVGSAALGAGEAAGQGHRAERHKRPSVDRVFHREVLFG